MEKVEQSFETPTGGLVVDSTATEEQLKRRPIYLDDGREVHPVPGDSVRERSYRCEQEIEGYTHQLYVSEPRIKIPNAPDVYHYPGYMEHAAFGIGGRFHETLARFQPGARVISVATDGFGPDSQRYGFDERDEHNLVAMGASRAAIIETLTPPEKPITWVGTSMGTIIMKEATKHLSPERFETIRGGVLNACALVEIEADNPYNHLLKFSKFGISIVPDILKEVKHTPFHHWPSLGQKLWRSGYLSRHDALTLAHLGVDILSGSEASDIDAMLQKLNAAQFSVLIGENDPVGEMVMWLRRSQDYNNLTVRPVPGRSHGIVVNPVRNGRGVSKLLYETNVVSLPLGLVA